MATVTKSWTLLVCPTCGYCEGLDVYDEVLLCPCGEEPTMMRSLEVVPRSEVERLRRIELAAREFTDKVQTYEQALDNLTEENWHTERELIEAEVKRLRAALEEIAAAEQCAFDAGCVADHLAGIARAALSSPAGSDSGD